jgi:YidC/Oxa1 family membrane protein insertase
MDRRTLILVLLLALVFFLYQPLLRMAGLGRYLERPMQSPAPAAVDTVRRDSGRAVPFGGTAPATPLKGAMAGPGGPPGLAPLPLETRSGVPEVTSTIETPLYRAVFSNLGARLLSLELKRYVAAHGSSAKDGRPLMVPAGREVPAGDRVVLAGDPLFALDLGSGEALRPLDRVAYTVTDSEDASGAVRALTFIHRDSSGVLVRQTWRVRPDTYVLDLEVEMRGIPDSWRLSDYSLSMRNWPAFTETDRKTDERYVRTANLVGKNLHRDHPPGLLKGAKEYSGVVEWAAVQSRYFLCATAVEQGIPRAATAAAAQWPLTAAEAALIQPNERPVKVLGVSRLVMALPSPERPVQRFLVYTGPSDLRILSRLGHELPRAVDLGWNWIRPISELLLRLLDWIHVLVRNYGLAILALAVLARVVLHPLNASSLKSMRAMQRLAPEIDRLKQKYKNDAQALNTAMMALYKENKVNPMGGCLPVLLQMPILMALYQVLLNAIELRQAPFVSWINDLSAPDVLFVVANFPVRLLPILMTGSGFLLTKLTPSNPQQAPTAYMMNAFMLVLFYNLPSGLVFYWTILNLMTALQQWMVLRNDDGAAIVVPAEPERKRKG